MEIIITASPINKHLKNDLREHWHDNYSQEFTKLKKVLKAVAVRHNPKNVSYHTI
mgnify:CR=1 FL=1